MFELPFRYQEAIIEKDNPEGWDLTLYEIATEYLTEFTTFSAQGMAPFFAGAPGTGKTYAAAAIINRILSKYQENGYQIDYCWVSVGETLDRIMADRDYRLASFYEADRAIKTAPLVVMDDFAHLRDYPRLREMFWVYVNARYDRMLPTIFTANIDLSDGWEPMDKMFGEHVRRRVQEMSKGLIAV